MMMRYLKQKRVYALLAIIFLYPTAMINSQENNVKIKDVVFLYGDWEFDPNRIDDFFSNAVDYQKRNYSWFWSKNEVKKRKKVILNDKNGIPEYTFLKTNDAQVIEWTTKRKDGFNKTTDLSFKSIDGNFISFIKEDNKEPLRFLTIDSLNIDVLIKDMDFGIPYKKKNSN